MPDQDGYPTGEELTRIQTWTPFMDYVGLMAFVKSIWWCADWGWHESPYIDGAETGTEYRISTGGWSGNEEIIRELKGKPTGFWSTCWQQTRRGGHYTFRVKATV